MFRIFVYGTLKAGYANHCRLCDGHQGLTRAALPGRIFDRPEGFPTLFVPPEHILGYGSGDLQADLELQRKAARQTPPDLRHPNAPWRMVLGESLCFADCQRSLPALDDLEDFSPGEPSIYCRVLLWCLCAGRPVPAWAYISPHNARFADLMNANSRQKPIPAP